MYLSSYFFSDAGAVVLRTVAARWGLVTEWYSSRRRESNASTRKIDEDELVPLGRATLSAYFKALDAENANVLETDMKSLADFYVKNVLGDFSWKLNVSSVAELIGFFSVYCSSCVERKCPKTCVHR
jgi:hypothetical protein